MFFKLFMYDFPEECFHFQLGSIWNRFVETTVDFPGNFFCDRGVNLRYILRSVHEIVSDGIVAAGMR